MDDTRKSLVSIIVPVYNTENYLKRCIDSILEQTYKKFELILVDDGSTDNSKKICDDYAAKDNRVRVFHKENGGQGTARNLGLDESTGDYICFVDSDDIVSENYLSTLLAACIEDNSMVAVCNVDKRDAALYSDYSIFMINVLLDNIGGQLWKFLFKKSLWNNIKIPENRYAEDAMVLPKVLISSKSISVIYQQLYFYNAENPVSSSNSKSKLLKNTIDRALMFIERYTWVQENGYPATKDIILRKAAEFSIGAMGCYKKYEHTEKDIEEIYSFLKNKKQDLLKHNSLSFGRKVAIILITINPNIYYLARNICKN